MDITKIVIISGRYREKTYEELVKELRDKNFQVVLFGTAEDAKDEIISLFHADYVVFDPNGLASNKVMYNYIDDFIELGEGANTIFLVVDLHMIKRVRKKIAGRDEVCAVLYQNIKRAILKQIKEDTVLF